MKKIMITAPVHQDTKIFREYLWSLNRLEIPEGYTVDKYFYLHNADNLKKFLQPNEYEVFNDNLKLKQNEPNHIITIEKLNATAKMRTKALEKAREENYDYVFSVDSDIILHSKTLIELISKEKNIISEIYWTTWNYNQPYIILPNFYDDKNEKGISIYHKNLNYYKIIDTYSVGVVSSPLLISSKIFNEPLINYNPINILSTSYWNEYAFCVRCKCLFNNINFYIDTSHPVRHLYTEQDYENWIKWEKKEWE